MKNSTISRAFYPATGCGSGGNSACLDMPEMQLDRADGKGSVMPALGTTPNYPDPAPLPAAPTKWKSRAIYRVNDAQVGVWSNTVEITVGGETPVGPSHLSTLISQLAQNSFHSQTP